MIVKIAHSICGW